MSKKVCAYGNKNVYVNIIKNKKIILKNKIKKA